MNRDDLLARIYAERKLGTTMSAIADKMTKTGKFGTVTKNQVIGMLHRFAKRPGGQLPRTPAGPRAAPVPTGKPLRTLFDRCDALHAKLDQVLAECRHIK